MITMENKNCYYSTIETKFLLSYKKLRRRKFKETYLMKNHMNDSKHLKSLTYCIFNYNTITWFQLFHLMKVYVTEVKQYLFNQQFLCINIPVWCKQKL